MHGGATSAPPPTPSNNLMCTSDAATADALSRLLHRLPPTLSSLPTRRSPPTTCPQSISFSDVQANPTLLSCASQLGLFQLTNHPIPSQLANSAESEALSLFDLPAHQKQSSVPKSWPLGFEDDDEDNGDGLGESFCLDSLCSTESTELTLTSLREFTRALEKVGMEVIELLCSSLGFQNPLGKDDPTRFSTMMWISEGLPDKKSQTAGRFYPYVVGLQYQIRSSQKYSLLADSGWLSVLPQVDSIMVTIGDIAQVWSNGKLKKVRGRPVACLGNDSKPSGRCISMSLLVTLPMDSTLSPLLQIAAIDGNDRDDDNDDEGDQIDSRCGGGEREAGRLFKSFCLEDYAWRVYHERLFFKDPLDRYRIKKQF
ncbi:gibberellin 2-beta-dioxygenase 2 [Pyrus x bretschneideri]|uniref:gibberellin 2-beta-dioxygenase 2 n=1 Tax=Pyrus x bretschneideri TaxID=225117 RepID=UPI00203082A2|nr:gibberellin 2-beta-dioxygenase 2 [Pyrus x bretschneideri]